MKKDLKTILTIVISVFVIAGFVYAANTFPTTLNSWTDGDIIESDWANSLEDKIGINSSTVKTSLDYKTTVNIELQGTASASYGLFSNTLQINGFSSQSYSRFGTNTTTGSFLSGANDLLITGRFEVDGSVSFDGGFKGSGLTDCDTAATSKLLWDTTSGKFSCGTDQTSVASNSLNFDEFQNPLVLDTNITTTSASFNWDFGGTNFANVGSASFTRGFKIANGTGDNLFRITSGGIVNAGTWNGTAIDISSFTNLTAGTDLTLTGDDLTLDSTLTQAFSFTNTGSQSMTGSLNVAKGLVANAFSGGGLTICNASGNVLRFAGGQFSCGTLADADIPDTISLIGGTIGANNISGTQTTTGTLTFGDNGDNIVFDSNVWDISAAGVANFNAVGSHSFGGSVEPATSGIGSLGTTAKKWSQIVGNLIHAVVKFVVANLSFEGNTISSTTGGITIAPNNSLTNFTGSASVSANFEVIGYASASAYYGEQVLWKASIASTSNEFQSGGLLPLPRLQSNRYVITQILCSVDTATSVVINVSNKSGTYDTETVTCTTSATGNSDTAIGTNPNYLTFTTASSALEFGTVTGTVDWLDFTIIGKLLPP